MSEYQSILELIEGAKTITIFRHVRPDGDAVGSQLGLKQWIKDNYPEKEVYALGEETFDTYPYVDRASDDVIKNSLAIILDVSNRERIDDDRWDLAPKSIKIDHHPAVDEFALYNYVKEEAAATCEYLTLILASFKKKISKEAAKYLYSGILTDTLSFKTASTSKETMKAAFILADADIDIYDITENIFKQSEMIFNFRTYLRTKITNENGLAYVIFDDRDYDRFGISDSQARFQVAEMNGVDAYKIWCIFTKNSAGHYDGSLRSKKGYVVNEIAAKFNGGGHANAAGVKNLNDNDLKTIIDELRSLL